MKRQKQNYLKGAKVVISDHSLKRYLVRCEVMTEEEYATVKTLADEGDKTAIQRMTREREILTRKFQNSRLSKFLGNGIEMRREQAGSKVTRCTFVAEKKGNVFVIVTAYLQGKKNDHWKVGTNKEVERVG